MREPVVGIDLGTTNSVLASVDDDGRPRVIPNRAGGRLTPSMVGFQQGERVVGARAKQLSESAPEEVAFATKRFIGQRWTEELASKAKTLVPYRLVPGPSGE